MTLQLKALHSRFGRRLLLLFVGCAVVPIAIVAFVSYRHVSRHLLAQSEARLHQANRALGRAVFERLLLLDATLRSIPPRAVLQLAAGPQTLDSTPAPVPASAPASRKAAARAPVSPAPRSAPRTLAAPPSATYGSTPSPLAIRPQVLQAPARQPQAPPVDGKTAMGGVRSAPAAPPTPSFAPPQPPQVVFGYGSFERWEVERREAERWRAERIEAELREAERRQRELAEAARREAERLEAERREAEQREASRALVAGLDLLARRRFEALEFVGEDGSRIPVFGRLDHLPTLSARDSADLRLGLPLVTTEPQVGGAARIYMVRRVERNEVRGHFVGEISPEFLWGTLDQGMPSPATRVTVVDDSGRVLFASAAGRAAGDASGRDPAVADLVVSSRPLVLGDVFAAPTWRLVLGQPRDEVLQPMVPFTRTFLLVVVLAVAAVLALSAHQIRRSLLPMHELQAGTRRIAERDFASRIAITSGDEFEELGASFNAMAAQLGRQFQALDTAAELDRAVLSTTDANEIVTLLLSRMRDVYPCSMASITLVAPDGAKSLPGTIHDYGDDSRVHVRVDLRSPDVHELLDGPDVLVYDPDDGEDLPTYLAPLVARGARSLLVLPLRFGGQLVGVIALGDRGEGRADLEDAVQARRLADQAAVALANARMLEQVRTLAYYDSLTGLPNRLSYKQRLDQALEQARRTGRKVAAFFIDLDHFSRINDTLGHEAGDQLLQQVAARLRQSCREREDDVGPAARTMDPDVARLGGDEFTVIMPGLSDPRDADKLARRLLASLAHPFRLGDHDIFVNASIGIAIFPEDGEDLDSLLMHADTAMYKAKEQGGGSYQAYSRSMNATALQRLTLENALRRALERDEFEVHYQPIVDARTGAPVAAEALVRWRHPELGLLLPSEFIALAEENGLIVPLGERIIRTACAENRAWQRAGLPPIRIVVNLSSRQLARGVTETVARILHDTGLEARWLGLELTESVLVNHQKEGADTLHALRAMGLHLSVDDFGTGYSSFSYLKHFPLDTLKIDRCFVREIASDADDAAITTAMIAMGHALGLKVVAEGVETETQQALLRRQGVDEMQGYLFSRPLPAARFAEYLREQRSRMKPNGRRGRAAGVA